MTAKKILENYLKANGFDGLCHGPTECACGLDDLVGPCEGAQPDCKPAYRIDHPQGGPWYVVMDHRPSEQEVLDYWEEREAVE